MSAPRQFFARGKLLITGEYGVVHGARALAVPTKLGQYLTHTSGSDSLNWTAYDMHGDIWLQGNVTSDPKLSMVRECIAAALTLRGTSTWPTGSVETHLEFERHWGLGSSSTLVALIAQWLEVDALALHFAVSKGSGYDVACANSDNPIFYRRNGLNAELEPADLSRWPIDEIHLVYLGQKKDSQAAVATYLQRPMNDQAQQQLSDFADQFAAATSASQLAEACNQHEAFLAPHLGLHSPVSEITKNAYAGGKSLGAWGGDFALMVGPLPSAMNYLQSHELGPVFSWKEVCID